MLTGASAKNYTYFKLVLPLFTILEAAKKLDLCFELNSKFCSTLFFAPSGSGHKYPAAWAYSSLRKKFACLLTDLCAADPGPLETCRFDQPSGDNRLPDS